MSRIRYVLKGELEQANRRALEAKCRALEPSFVEGLPECYRYPVMRQIPWERHGWVRCEIGTATGIPAVDYLPVWLDVPQDIYDNLESMAVPVIADDESK